MRLYCLIPRTEKSAAGSTGSVPFPAVTYKNYRPMEIFHWKEYWNKMKGSLRKIHPELSDEDLDYQDGKEAELIERLSLKLRTSSAELNEVLFIHLIAMLDEPEDSGVPEDAPGAEGMDPETLLKELEREMQDPSSPTGRWR